eukprot:6172092-Pleurochrysis_carterae.AAC.1
MKAHTRASNFLLSISSSANASRHCPTAPFRHYSDVLLSHCVTALVAALLRRSVTAPLRPCSIAAPLYRCVTALLRHSLIVPWLRRGSKPRSLLAIQPRSLSAIQPLRQCAVPPFRHCVLAPLRHVAEALIRQCATALMHY